MAVNLLKRKKAKHQYIFLRISYKSKGNGLSILGREAKTITTARSIDIGVVYSRIHRLFDLSILQGWI